MEDVLCAEDEVDAEDSFALDCEMKDVWGAGDAVDVENKVEVDCEMVDAVIADDIGESPAAVNRMSPSLKILEYCAVRWLEH